MHSAAPIETTRQASFRRPFFPAIHWGAILAGVIVGLAVQLALTLLGIAAGLTAMDPRQGEAGLAGDAPLWAAVWHGASMLLAAFVGGYVAARMSGLLRKTDGALHGFVAWAVTTLLFAFLATSAVGSLLGGVYNGLASMAGPAAGMAAPGDPGQQLGSLLGGSSGAREISPQAVGELQRRIRGGDREGAIEYMTSNMGFEQSRAAALVDQALMMTGAPERASPQARAAAGEMMDSASLGSWLVFGAVALSLALGVFGGMLGAMNQRRAPPGSARVSET